MPLALGVCMSMGLLVAPSYASLNSRGGLEPGTLASALPGRAGAGEAVRPVADRGGGSMTSSSGAPDFVRRRGSELLLGSRQFHVAGANVPWLGLLPRGLTPTHEQIRDGLLAAKGVGANTVRSLTLGESVGCENCVEPRLGEFNQSALDTIDYADYEAGKLGLRLIIPLVDNWNFYEGGTSTFTGWDGDPQVDEFFTDPAVIKEFDRYEAKIITQVNPYTGRSLGDDPTILAWETGNELMTTNGTWDAGWTERMARYIKSLAPNQLVIDGHLVDDKPSGSELDLPSVDCFVDHMYPPYPEELVRDSVAVAAHGKVYLLEEYDWRNVSPEAAATYAPEAGGPRMGSVSVTIDRASATDWSVQLLQPDMGIGAGSYELSFEAHVSSRHPISVGLQRTSTPYTPYSSASISLSPSISEYEARLSVPTGVAANVQLEFNLAAASGTVQLSNVRLALDGKGRNVVRDGEFSGGSVPSTDWFFQLKLFGASMPSFYNTVQSLKSVAGDLFWQLIGSPEESHEFGGDEYELAWPAFQEPYSAAAQALSNHLRVEARM